MTSTVECGLLPSRLQQKIQLEDNGCWRWIAATSPNGYGAAWDGTRVTRAHRVVYVLLVGEIPEGHDLDHLCRNRWCVNPEHLEPVSRKTNARRGLKGALKTHCAQGHPWIPENIYLNRTINQRCCLICLRARNRAAHHRRKAAAAR